MERDAAVGNTADRKQLEKAKRRETEAEIRDRDDFGMVVSTLQGRRYIWKLLGRTKVFESVWHPSALIHYQSGQQDIGHQIQAEFVRDFPELYFLMIKENSNV